MHYSDQHIFIEFKVSRKKAETLHFLRSAGANIVELTFSHMQLNVMIKKGPIKNMAKNIEPNFWVPSKVSM